MESKEKSITIHLSDDVMHWLWMKAHADYHTPEQVAMMIIAREYEVEKRKVGHAIRGDFTSS